MDIHWEARGVFGEDTVSERFGQAPDEIPDRPVIFHECWDGSDVLSGNECLQFPAEIPMCYELREDMRYLQELIIVFPGVRVFTVEMFKLEVMLFLFLESLVFNFPSLSSSFVCEFAYIIGAWADVGYPAPVRYRVDALLLLMFFAEQRMHTVPFVCQVVRP